ncbi:LPS-assembly protein LptD [Croceicoccus naphthovorans]|uniref:LPS-assembly protein LptD n=1 Tax=Croceicoccus naphthovorans TaxID=1348774 RepID=UPI00069CE05D|nr:LPS assembly protein LptD [Croceicoccus naphthovorans]MBB3990450.1 LPS-assembly protein [Croceicoccus naphthovorans]
MVSRVTALRHSRAVFLCTAATFAIALTAPARAQDSALENRGGGDTFVNGNTGTVRGEDYFWTGGKNPEPEPKTEFRIPAAEDPDSIAFEADDIGFDTDTDIVTASGDVVLRRADQQLVADQIRWDRNTGEIVASGNIALTDVDGNTLYTDRIELTDELRAGAMENMLLVMGEGARMAARTGTRAEDGTIALTDVAYSPCPVETPDGCPRDPTWRITANSVRYNPDTQKINFKGARLELFGLPLIPLFGLSVRADDKPQSGFTTPNLRFSNSNGVELLGEYYWRLAENRELTLGANLYSKVAPMVSARYAALTEDGAYQVTGYATNSSRIPTSGETVSDDSQRDLRGYLNTNGRFQLDPYWSITGSIRVTTDRTFLRRYDISRSDRLRSLISAERIDDNSYLAITGWATQTLVAGEDQGLVPYALPLVDYRRRIGDPLLGGKITLQANSLFLERSDGQDTRRAFAGATWSRRELTGMGQEITFTGLVRGDVYHSDNNELTTVDFYRGESGWQTRGVATGAIDVKWPLVGGFLGGTQVLTPRVQIVATPQIDNLAIPNEDARAVDLEDSNLFALNRFPGYDRVEDGARITYGYDWRWDAPGWRLTSTLGQSYRLSSQSDILPDGTGLTSRTSDIVGRNTVRFRDFLSFTHRFRIDKDELVFRRNEFDVALGTRKTYVEAGYLKLDRNIPDRLEDLRDREELRLAGRVAFANYWSIFGSTVINLTDESEDPSLTSDGFDTLRTRLGLSYDDDCLSASIVWRRDTIGTGDAKEGNTFLLKFRLRNLGF